MYTYMSEYTRHLTVFYNYICKHTCIRVNILCILNIITCICVRVFLLFGVNNFTI